MQLRFQQISIIFVIILILSTFLYSITFTQEELYDMKPPPHLLMRSEKKITTKNENKVLRYFKGITQDVINDGIHSVIDIPGTFENMFTIPFRQENLTSTRISLGFLGGSFFLDEKANYFLKNKWEPYCEKYPFPEKFPLPVSKLGLQAKIFYYDKIFLAFAEYGYVFGILSRNTRFRTLCFNLMECTAYSFLFAQPAKALTGRARPWRENTNFKNYNPWEWGHTNTYMGSNGEYNSFPSFHAVYWFSYWTVLMDYFGYRWAGPIVASIFYCHVDHLHWFSDMVAGGIFGYWLGAGIIDKSKENNKNYSKVSVMIYPINKGVGINISKRF